MTLGELLTQLIKLQVPLHANIEVVQKKHKLTGREEDVRSVVEIEHEVEEYLTFIIKDF
jgi:hypothetical protein